MSRRRPESGVALALALLMLLILTVIGVSSLRSSIFEFQMARNEEARVSAFQRAQSIVDGTVSKTSNLIVAGKVDDTTCIGPYFSGCTATGGITLDTTFSATGSPFIGRTSVRVTRLAPEYAPAPAWLGASSAAFEAAQFSVEGTYDATDRREGRAGLGQGVMVLVAVGQQ